MTESNSWAGPASTPVPGEPAWFTDACAQLPTSDETEVDGCRIRYLTWAPAGPASARPLLLLHGTAAHAHWWSHIAPLLADDRVVVAMDFSGHGDSDHRPGYEMDLWADEVLALADLIGGEHGVHVAGHSLGGIVATVAAARGEGPIRGLAQIETIRDTTEPHFPPDMRPSRRRYATAAEILARFEPKPRQPDNLEFVVDHVARHSVREYDDGWGWKHDPDLVLGLKEAAPAVDTLAPLVPCPLAVIHGEHGFVSRLDGQRIAEVAPLATGVVELPAAGHHPMFDQPLALTVALRLVLSTWEVA